MPTILITGVSTGIGRACAEKFDAEGWRVVGTVRDVQASRASLPERIALERLDLAEPGAGGRLAADVLERHGCPDAVVNNAGSLQFGPLEAVGSTELEELYRINVFGPMELVRGLVPAMRERGSGTIVNVTSLGGRLVFPFFAAYNSTKWALEGLSEGLWHELRPFGIRVKAIEPGFVQTAIWSKVLPPPGEPLEGPEPYLPFMSEMREFEASITDRTTPERAAEELYAAVLDDSDRLRYPIAAYARPMTAARRVLGDRLTMRFFHTKWMGDDA